MLLAARAQGRDPLRQEAQFLRARARRLREIATTAQTILSSYEELEARADELSERTRPAMTAARTVPATPRSAMPYLRPSDHVRLIVRGEELIE